MKPTAPVVVKSIAANSVSKARLGVRMKTQSRCPVQVKSPCSKVSLLSENGSKVTKRQVKSGARPLSATWSSAHSFSELRNTSALKHLNEIENRMEEETPTIPSKVLSNCDETYTVKEPTKQKVNDVKTMDKPKPKINSSQHFVQLLKKKDTEILGLKKKVKILGQSGSHKSGLKPDFTDGAAKSSVEIIKLLEERLKQQNEEMMIVNGNNRKLEEDLSSLKNEIALKDAELGCLKLENSRNNELIERLLPLSSRKPTQKAKEMHEENHEMQMLKEEKLRLIDSIRKQEDDLSNLNAWMKHFPEAAHVDRAEVELAGDNNTDLEKETAEFLEKVSDVCRNKSLKIKAQSKDKNVKINLKITVRKDKLDRVSHQLSFSEVLESPGIYAKTPCQTFSVKEDEEDDSVFVDKVKLRINPVEEGYCLTDDIKLFANPCESLLENSRINLGEVSEIMETSGFNGNDIVGIEGFGNHVNNNYRASLGTLDRAEDLDMKLQALWSRLSSQGDTLKQLKSEKRRFTFSVDLLEEELTESRTQHRNLVEQVNIAKKLFH